MIPVLFDKNETDFTTMGIGALTDCVSVIVKRVLNGQDELAITYPDTGVRANDIQNSCIIMAQPEYKKPAQPYVIYNITKPVKGLMTIYARHIRERASFIPVMPFTASSLAETLMKIPDYCAETNPFTFWTDKSVVANFNLKTPASLGNVFGGMEGSILDTYGGEYEFDGFTVKIWNRRGVNRGVTLRYGKNIVDATQEESIERTITGVCPYWISDEDGLVTLSEKVVYSQNAANFPFHRTVVHDFTEDFDTKPTEAQLRARAEAYISQTGIGVPDVKLSVSYEQLEQYAEYKDVAISDVVNLGDTVTVIFEKLGVNATARVVQTEYDVLNEKYRKVAIGGVKSNLNSTIKEAAVSAQSEANNALRASLQQNIDRATDMLTGANGGYLVDIFDANGQRTGDMIMDTNDPATATNVWLRNLAGWGYSSTGVNGQYRTAITQDGHIVADFIDTGNLTANVIKAGTIQSSQNANNYWDLNTGEIKISNNANIAGWEIKSSYLGKSGTLNGTPYLAFVQAPETPTGNGGVFGLRTGSEGNYNFPFIVRYNGTVEATNAIIEGTITTAALTATGGTIGGWTIGTSGLSKGTTFDNHDYEVGMWSPTTPQSTTPAFYVGYPTGVGSAWEYVFKVDYSGKLTATKAEITGNITGSTITSSVDKTFQASNYSQSDLTTVGNIILSGKYPTASQLAKYDFNRDGLIDIVDLAVINGFVQNNKQSYTTRTAVTISPTDANIPIKVSSGGAYDDGTITLSQGSVVSVNHMQSGAFIVHDGSSVRASLKNDALTWYDSSGNRTAYYNSNSVVLDGASFNSGYLELSGVTLNKSELLLYGNSSTVEALYGSSGIYFMNSSGYHLMTLSTSGLSYRNASNKQLMGLTTSAMSFRDSSENVLMWLSTSGINFRNASGNKLIDLASTGLTFRNSSGTETGAYSAFRASGYVSSWSVSANSTATKTVSFGKTFPAAPYVWVQFTQSADRALYGNVQLAVTATTTTGFTVMAFNASSTDVGVPFRWMTF